jgi:hypothetical protein
MIVRNEGHDISRGYKTAKERERERKRKRKSSTGLRHRSLSRCQPTRSGWKEDREFAVPHHIILTPTIRRANGAYLIEVPGRGQDAAIAGLDHLLQHIAGLPYLRQFSEEAIWWHQFGTVPERRCSCPSRYCRYSAISVQAKVE